MEHHTGVKGAAKTEGPETCRDVQSAQVLAWVVICICVGGSYQNWEKKGENRTIPGAHTGLGRAVFLSAAEENLQNTEHQRESSEDSCLRSGPNWP